MAPGTQDALPRRRQPSGLPLVPAAAAVIITAAGIHALASRLLPSLRRRRATLQHRRFQLVYADTSDRPFPHLPPQPYDSDCTVAFGSSLTVASAAAEPTAAMAEVAPVPGPASSSRSRAVTTEDRPVGPRAPQAGDPGRPSAAVAGTGLVHPYLARIQRLMAAPTCPVLSSPPPPPSLAEAATAAAGAPLALAPTPAPVPGAALPDGCRVRWVARPAELYDLGRRLRQERQIGLDTEASTLHSYHGTVCLIQLSVAGGGGGSSGDSSGGGGTDSLGKGQDGRRCQREGSGGGLSGGGGAGGGKGGVEVWLVDTLALHDHVGPALGELMADPRVVKVVHGGSNDVVWLQRDFRIYLVNMFDTEKACQVLGYSSRALASLLLLHAGLDMAADKAAGQRADWRRRPLPPPLRRYAAADVAYLPYLADVLRRELAARDPAWPSLLLGPGPSHPSAPAIGDCAGSGGDCASLSSSSAAAFIQAPLYSLQPATAGGPTPPPTRDPHPAHPSLGDPGDSSAAGAVMRPAPTPLGHALLRSHQLSLTLYRKPLSDAAAAAGAAGAAGGAAAGTASATAAGVLRRFFNGGGGGGGAAATGRATAEPSEPPQCLATGAASKAQPSARVPATRSATSGGSAAARGLRPTEAAAADVADSVFALCRWRDATARRLDVGPQLLLPDGALAELAAARPPPGDGRALLRAVEKHLAAANEALKVEPFAPRHDLHPALRQHAEALSRLLAAASAGRLPAAAAAGLAAAGSGQVAARGAANSGGGLAGMGRRTRGNPDAAQERRSWVIKKFSAKNQVYQNCRMLSREGQLLCFCDARKVAWYMAKGLAVQVCEDPPTIQLLFEHQNTDQQMGADDFYTQSKSNRCVACGCASHYLRYRVMPACYRRHMPPALKSHRSHDVVLLCIDCHERAQKAAELLKRQVALDYGVPLLPPRTPALAVRQQSPGPPGSGSGGGATGAGGRKDMLSGSSSSRAGNLDKQAGGGGGADGAGDNGGMAGVNGGSGGGVEGAHAECRTGEGEGEDGDGGEGGGEDDEGGLPGGIHPSAARRAALALQKNGAQMPEARVRQLEGVIKAALGRDPRAEEPGLRPGDLEAALLAGLGRRGRNKYFRTIKQHQQQQEQAPGPEKGRLEGPPPPAEKEQGPSQQGGPTTSASVGTASQPNAVPSHATPATDVTATAAATDAVASASNAAPRVADRWLDSGHMWHGERVVRLAMQRGGEEELLHLIKRFRACFVGAVQPQYLPPAWEVDHAARRDFGPYSVYAAERRRAEAAAAAEREPRAEQQDEQEQEEQERVQQEDEE